MVEFCCLYKYRGYQWGFTIHAIDHADAEKRLAAMQAFGGAMVQGRLMATIPAGIPGAGWWVRSACAVRNFFRSRK